MEKEFLWHEGLDYETFCRTNSLDKHDDVNYSTFLKLELDYINFVTDIDYE